jgi:hypothetical protein
MVAANLAVTAVLASLLIKMSLSWREWLAVIGVVAGVGLLGSSAGPEGATAAGAVFKLLLIVATAVLGVAGLAAARLRDPLRTLLLGVVAGFGYGLIGIAARVLNGFEPLSLLRDPAAYAVAAAGIVSFMFYATALEGGSVTVATAAVVLAETLPPAVIGVAFLGDKTRPGLEPAAIAGFVVAVFSAVLLARFGEAHDAGPTHGVDQTRDAGQGGQAQASDQVQASDHAQASDQVQASDHAQASDRVQADGQAQAGDQAQPPGDQAQPPGDQAQPPGDQAQPPGGQAQPPGGQAKAPGFPEDAGDLPGRCQVT